MNIKFTEKMKRRPLIEFKRDKELKNGLIEGGWLRRGQFSMITSTTGAGKSVLCTQMAISWTLGKECCGLKPLKPLKVWVIQSEDDEDRVARGDGGKHYWKEVAKSEWEGIFAAEMKRMI